MAEPDVIGPTPDRAANLILQDWLDQLAAALRPAPTGLRDRIVAEMRDGLHSTAEHHLETGAEPVGAAHDALAEFGDPHLVAASFGDELAAHLARRTAITLIATGPLVGAVWLATLVPPLWPPRPTDLLGAHPLTLAVVAVAVLAALLTVAMTGSLSRQLATSLACAARIATRTAILAASACVAADGLLLLTLIHLASTDPAVLVWPTALLAAAASSTRLGLATRAAHRCGCPITVASPR